MLKYQAEETMGLTPKSEAAKTKARPPLRHGPAWLSIGLLPTASKTGAGIRLAVLHTQCFFSEKLWGGGKKGKKATTPRCSPQRHSRQYSGGIPFGLFLCTPGYVWIRTHGSHRGAYATRLRSLLRSRVTASPPGVALSPQAWCCTDPAGWAPQPPRADIGTRNYGEGVAASLPTFPIP